jgi:hypothetical protein
MKGANQMPSVPEIRGIYEISTTQRKEIERFLQENRVLYPILKEAREVKANMRIGPAIF